MVSLGPSPPLASSLGFRSRIWILLLVFGFFSVFDSWFIWVFVLIVAVSVLLVSEVYCPESGPR